MAQSSPADSSYLVHLHSLQDFGRELAAQIEAVNSHARNLTDPATAAMPLGDFGEAISLHQRHAEAVAEMTSLLDRVEAAISFAERVTGTVADSYTSADSVAAAAISRGVQA